MNEHSSKQETTAPRPPITDSPWFWGYVFSAAALIALALAAPKYSSRQAQLERQFLARQKGGQTISAPDGSLIDVPHQDNLIVTLVPLIGICCLLLIVAWSRFWLTRFGFQAALSDEDRDQCAAADRAVDVDPSP